MNLLIDADDLSDVRQKGLFMQQMVRPIMEEIRVHADLIESMMDKSLYPIPTYTDLLFTFD